MSANPINFTDYQRNRLAPEMAEAVQQLLNRARDEAYRSAEAVTRADMAREYQRRLEFAIFISIAFGIVLGAVLVVVVAGWWS